MEPNQNKATSPEHNNSTNPQPVQQNTPQAAYEEPGQIQPHEASWMPQPIVNGQPAAKPVEPELPPSQAAIPPAPPNNFPSYNSLSTVPPPKKSKKKLIAGLVTVLIMVGAGVGGVFGYYLPNKPENVYRTGMERSGEAIDKLVYQATEKDQLDQIKKSEMDGLLEFSSDEGSFNGNFNVKMDPSKSDGRLDIKIKESDKPEEAFGLKFLTEAMENKRFPNIYFQMTGIQTLQLEDFAPGMNEYEGKWIAVEADYLESLGSGFIPPDEDKNKENVSAEEVASLIRAISEVTNEYLFSSDPDKAVLENRGYLGKETTAEGVKAFHYKVGINKENAVAYCKAFTERVFAEPIVKKISDADDAEIEKTKKETIKDCDDTAKDVKTEETFEMWVDSKYKVIHKFRVYDEKDKKDAYTDFGQVYTGGDKLALFVKYHQDKDNLNVKATLDVDIDSNNSKLEVTAKQEGDDSFDGHGSLSAKPYSGEINASRPEGAIPIKDILARFGYDPTAMSGIEANAENEKYQRCAKAYKDRANNNGQGSIPVECESL